jgi:hypothetical protein
MDQTYNTPDFGAINQELRAVLTEMATSKAQAFTKLATELEKNMGEPNWTIETLNQVEGTIGRAKLSLQSAISFTFSDADLIKPPVLDAKEQGALEQLAQSIGGDSEGDTLAEVVAQSVQPQVVGSMSNARSMSLFVIDQHDKKIALSLAPKGYCLLKAVEEAILIDYSLMLSPLDAHGQLVFVFDEALFAQNMYVAKTLLQNRKTFTQRYQWSDTTHGKQLAITVDATFSPHA